MKTMLVRYHLAAPNGRIDLPMLRSQFDETVAQAKDLGSELLVARASTCMAQP
jgi:hypothetical protein